MNAVRAANGGRGSFRETDEADLPFPDELRHGAHCLLDRRIRIDAVLIVEIDVIDTEAPQRAFAGAADVVGLSVNAEERAFGRAHVTELGGDDDAIAAVRYCA